MADGLMTITHELIEKLYTSSKKCSRPVKWNPMNRRKFTYFRFMVPVITEDLTGLEWRGYYQVKHGVAVWGFSLLYLKSCVVRSWDMAKSHYSKAEQRYIRGAGRHKHYFLNFETPREVYSIPEGEISIDDPDQAVIDFAAECRIDLNHGYQKKILI